MNPDFRDILSEFSAAGVEFLLVGAYAMAAHGVPRATGDIDLWIRCSTENARRVIAALTRFGAPVAGFSEADFASPGLVIQLGVTPNRIDILTEIDGVAFEDAWSDRVVLTVESISVPVISREHLLQNKLAAGRLKDQVDARLLDTGP